MKAQHPLQTLERHLAKAAKYQVEIQGYSTNSMGEPLRMSIPLVSTKDDISKNFLLSEWAKKVGKMSAQFNSTAPTRQPRWLLPPPPRPHSLFATSKLLNLTGSM